MLAVTGQFEHGASQASEARELVRRLDDRYAQAYYTGIICERQGIALFRRNGTGTGPGAYDWIREAMEWYEKAEPLRPAGNDDAILRWNTCARFLMRHPELAPRPQDVAEITMLE